MARNRVQHRGRKRPPKKPLDQFLDNVTEMLETVASTALFGAGAVLLGTALGTPSPPRIELPPGLPPEVVSEWERLMGVHGKPTRKRVKMAEAVVGTGVVEDPPPAPKPIKLLKGPDGVYRPET